MIVDSDVAQLYYHGLCIFSFVHRDRTAQICGVTQILLDPYFRTIEGFATLVEKEWCAFGHKFQGECIEVFSVCCFKSLSFPVDWDLNIRNLVLRFCSDIRCTSADRCGHGQVAENLPDERSPVFLQFLDVLHQLLLQFPGAFEFTESLLLFLADHLNSCLFGNFLGK